MGFTLARWLILLVAIPMISGEQSGVGLQVMDRGNPSGERQRLVCFDEPQTQGLQALPDATSADEITFTLDCWNDAFDSGNNCDFCSGVIAPGPPFTYNCNEGTAGGWTPSCSFVDPIGASGKVTAVTAVVILKDCSAQRGYSSATYSVSLNEIDVAGSHTLSVNNCSCVATPGCLQETFRSTGYAEGFPGYAYGGTNTLRINIITGALCVEKAYVTLTGTDPLRIVLPTNDISLAYEYPDYAARRVAFQADGVPPRTAIRWVADLDYSDGQIINFTNRRTFRTNISDVHNEEYRSMGGRLRITATTGERSQQVTAYVVGRTIPDDVITDRLVALYPRGATPRLMTGIAMTESTYRQFADRTLYGITARWPFLNGPAGTYVGMFQVEPTVERHGAGSKTPNMP
ncbi:MAG TPA: hypothetical protein VFO89_02715 [Thermoanaerobaculia bacterium]|nr:hypothetical protein [Thermoanaerobaculia bacterium]